MNNPIPRLLDALLPWRVIIREQRVRTQFLEDECARLRHELRLTVQERDTARRQFIETRQVNVHNAAAHRASEVAALMSNNAQNAEIDRLRALLPGTKGVVPQSREMPAMHVPKPLPVQQPDKLISP